MVIHNTFLQDERTDGDELDDKNYIVCEMYQDYLDGTNGAGVESGK